MQFVVGKVQATVVLLVSSYSLIHILQRTCRAISATITRLLRSRKFAGCILFVWWRTHNLYFPLGHHTAYTVGKAQTWCQSIVPKGSNGNWIGKWGDSRLWIQYWMRQTKTTSEWAMERFSRQLSEKTTCSGSEWLLCCSMLVTFTTYQLDCCLHYYIGKEAPIAERVASKTTIRAGHWMWNFLFN